jgi:hypothetical protein
MRQRRDRVHLPDRVRVWLMNQALDLHDYLDAGWDGGPAWRSLDEEIKSRLDEDDKLQSARIDEALGRAKQTRELTEQIAPLGSFGESAQSNLLKSHRDAAKRRAERRGD